MAVKPSTFKTSGTHSFLVDPKKNVSVITQNLLEDVVDIRDSFNDENPMPEYSTDKQSFKDFIESLKDQVNIEEGKTSGSCKVQYYFPDLKLGFNYYTMKEASETLGRKKKGWMIKDYNDCLSAGIHLVQVYQEEWELRHDVLVTKIKHQLKLQETTPIYPRCCTIREIDNREAGDFCDKNHIQGRAPARVNIGLFHDNKLIAVQTYGLKRICMGVKEDKRGDNTFELLRYCVDTGVCSDGAFGKMQKYFIDKYKPTEITTFADLRYTDKRNNIYIKNGYTFDHDTESNYWYFNYGNGQIRRYHRFNFRKQEVLKKFSPNCSEFLGEYENCLRNGYDRCWDAGNTLYVLRPNYTK